MSIAILNSKLSGLRRASEIIFPILFGAAFFALISYVIYAGNQRDQLAGRVERQLIRKSLKIMPWRAPANSAVSVVNESAEDVLRFGSIDHSYLKGIDLEVYAKALRRVLQFKPKMVVINWVPAVHGTDEFYLRPMLEAIAAAPETTQVLVSYPIYEIAGLPEEFRTKVKVLEGDDCGFDLQILCQFNPDWDDWIPQRLARELWVESEQGVPRNHVSDNLPHVRQSYLLNLPNQESLRSFSVGGLLDATDAELHSLVGGIVFIGSSVEQSFGYKADSTLVRRVRTALVGEETPIEKAVPFHVWLAQIAAMFESRETIAIAPREVTLGMILLLCSLIFVFQWRLGTAASLGIFILYASLYPFLNDALVGYFQIYLPMFDAIYVGLVVFLLAAFGRLSLQAHQRWIELERQKRLESDADIKTNFIAMISHNLNTPVAKMQGLVEMLGIKNSAWVVEAGYRRLNYQLARLQLAVRAVLITTAAEDRSLARQQFTVIQLRDDLTANLGPILKRFGVRLEMEIDTDPDDEALNFECFNADARAISFALLAWLWPNLRPEPMGLKAKMCVSRKGDFIHTRFVHDLISPETGEKKTSAEFLYGLNSSIMRAVMGFYSVQITDGSSPGGESRDFELNFKD
jgi:signal transduction histidine kinase